jgi:hypothetical protein
MPRLAGAAGAAASRPGAASPLSPRPSSRRPPSRTGKSALSRRPPSRRGARFGRRDAAARVHACTPRGGLFKHSPFGAAGRRDRLEQRRGDVVRPPQAPACGYDGGTVLQLPDRTSGSEPQKVAADRLARRSLQRVAPASTNSHMPFASYASVWTPVAGDDALARAKRGRSRARAASVSSSHSNAVDGHGGAPRGTGTRPRAPLAWFGCRSEARRHGRATLTAGDGVSKRLSELPDVEADCPQFWLNHRVQADAAVRLRASI